MYNTLMADQQAGEVIIPIMRDEHEPPRQEQVVAAPPYPGIATESGPANIPSPGSMPPSEPAPQVPPRAEVATSPIDESVTPDISPSISSPDFADSLVDTSITWQSVEYLTHDKNPLWYGGLVLGSIVISVIVYLLNHDVATAVIILFALVGLIYFSGRKPREQRFTVSSEGVQVGRNFYAFHDFRSFSVAEDPSSVSIILTPLKRFMPAVNILVPAEYEEKVVNLIADILPHEQHRTDVVDTLMRHLRF